MTNLQARDFDIADGADDVQAIGAEEVTFIDDQDKAFSFLVKIDDVIGEDFHEVLNARDADRQGDGKLRKDFAEEAALPQSRRDENQGGAISGGIEVGWRSSWLDERPCPCRWGR